jgi:hypothetical protein
VSLAFCIAGLAWFFGWGFLLLRHPLAAHKILSLGGNPDDKQLRAAKVVGWMGIVGGSILLLDLVFRLIR